MTPNLIILLSDNKPMKEDMDRQVEFERLLFEISSKFVNLPGAEVDREINDALKAVVEFLDVDQSVFGEFKGDGGTLKIIRGYTSTRWQESRGLMLNDIAPNFTRDLQVHEVVNLSRLPDHLPGAWNQEREYVKRVGLKSCVGIGLKAGGSLLGVIIFESYETYQHWTDRVIQQIRLLAQVFANAMERRVADMKLRQAFSKIKDLSERLKAENRYLWETISATGRYKDIVGRSRGIQHVLGKIEQVSRTESTVLFLGETGTGKTLLSRLVHQLSPRKNKTMLTVNCATLPANLLESELFGHEKGAFTGAISRKIGRFEIADGSTLFLDEIGELPLDQQAKLLKVLDDGEFERLGNATPIKVDVRIVAASNRDLAKMVKEGKFRQDLYYRLNVYPIQVPPLRERREDIPDLVWVFVREFCKTMGKNISIIPQKDLDVIVRHPWPGNIRELRNVVENAMISNSQDTLHLSVPKPVMPGNTDSLTFAEMQRRHITKILKTTRGRIKGPGGAADLLYLKPSTLYSKMKRLGIPFPGKNQGNFS